MEFSKFEVIVHLSVETDTYLSIQSLSQGLYKDKGSRFIALAWPVVSEDEAKEIVASLKKEYYDARHHCYAWRIGYKGDKFRANDDGEPSSTAGRPILGQIYSHSLSDILIVVVRYFGGIKLGVPGLIKAYKSASADAIANANIITKVATNRYDIKFGYQQMNSVMKLVKDYGIVPEKQDFGESCSMEVAIRLSAEADFLARLSKIGGCDVRQT